MTTRSRIESDSHVHVLCGKLQAKLIVMTMLMVMMMMMVVVMMMMMRFNLWSTPSSYTKTMQLMHTGAVSLPNDAYLYPMS